MAYSWDFGDGSTTTGSKLASHQYTAAGTYTATVTVTDSQGTAGSAASQPILVNDRTANGATPTALITATRISGKAPLPVTFNGSGSGSISSELTGSITGYSGNFGDGSTGSGMEILHTFTDPGRYMVQLTVSDSNGKQAVETANRNRAEPQQTKNSADIAAGVQLAPSQQE